MIESLACRSALNAAPCVRAKRSFHKTLCWASGPRRRNTSSMRSGVCGATGSSEKNPAIPHIGLGGRVHQQALIQVEQLCCHGIDTKALSKVPCRDTHGHTPLAARQRVDGRTESINVEGVTDKARFTLLEN